MSAARIEPDAGGGLSVSGALSFDSVTALWREGAALFEGRGDVRVDLQAVSRSDSAGLALLVEWTREAERRGQSIAYLNMPSQMLAIARVSGLDDVLPLARG